jgi:putative MATE family efflux protein
MQALAVSGGATQLLPDPHRLDLTRGSIASSVRRLAWPILLSQVLFMLPNLYDAVWLGRLGPGAQAAAGLAMTVRITLISVLMALSLASGALVARCLGARDQEQADLAASQAVVLMVLASAFLGVVGFVLARPLLTVAGADEAILPLAVRYARILFAGLIAMELVPSMGFMMSGAGAPNLMLAMSATVMCTLLVSEPFLVRSLGIAGAAIALVGANAAGMLLGLFLLASGRAPVRVGLRRLRPDLATMRRILRIALPALPQRGSQNLALSVIMRIVAGYGAPTLAAWVISERIYNTAVIPSMALARSAPAMVGRNLGADRPQRAEAAVRFVTRASLVANALVFGLLAVISSAVLGLFTDSAQVAQLGSGLVRLLAIGYVVRALAFVFDGAQSGAGDTASPMVINVLALWVVQVPLALLLPRVGELETLGVWLALIFGWTIQAAMMALRFRQGRWRTKRV